MVRFYKVGVYGEDRKRLKWDENQSKVYHTLRTAMAKYDWLKNAGMSPVIFQSPEFEWEQVEIDTLPPL